MLLKHIVGVRCKVYFLPSLSKIVKADFYKPTFGSFRPKKGIDFQNIQKNKIPRALFYPGPFDMFGVNLVEINLLVFSPALHTEI